MGIKRNNVKTEKDEWGTPWWLYNLLDSEFHFGLDAAAQLNNAKHKHYLHLKSLECDWKFHSHKKPAFLNPPHSAKKIKPFMRKASIEGDNGLVVVCLVPVASDTQWWHRYGMKAQEIRFIEGRVDYIGYDLEGKQIVQSPTFSSCVLIFDNKLKVFQEPTHTVCGLDEPCEEGCTKYEGEKCSYGYTDCYDDKPRPVIGRTIKVPAKSERDAEAV